ncbi:MAG: nucleotide exchange factor GrpE [Eggerthellaceae bacterium]|nr:nucleotide exchange factor GrpE [Eggerthellaceae bacterium]
MAMPHNKAREKDASPIDNAQDASAAEVKDSQDAQAAEPDEIEIEDADIADDEGAGEAEATLEEPSEAEIVAQARAEAADWKDKYIRLHAEWDTYRRRTNEQRSEERIRAAEKLITGLLPVLDDFERTIDYAQKNGETGLLSGVEAVYTKFQSVLQKDGVIILDPVDQPFDAIEDQAVATVEDTQVPEETVAQVFQKGYKLGKKVLRPAMVSVTTGGPKRPSEDK